MAINLASAYITIMPDTSKLADGIKKSLRGLDADGKDAGKKLADGMSKAMKGKGKEAGGDLGKEITDAMQRSLNGGATDVGKAGKKAADTFGKALDSELGNEVESAGKKASSRLSDAFSGLKFGAIAGAAAGLTTSLLGSFGDMARGAAEASDATDKFKTTLQFAGLDTSTIDEMTAKVQKYADETVYDLGDIQSMTAQLAANGVQNYEGLAEAAGNLNAVSGGNADTFKSVGMVMTQTAGAGKLTTENWNQLADAIPGASGKIQEALLDAGAYTGNFRDAMADGEITAEEFNDAVMKLGSEPVAEEAAKSTATFEGMLGNLQATIEGQLAQAFTELKPIIGAVVDGLSNAAGVVLPMFVGVVKAAAGALGFLGEHKGVVLGVVGALGSLTAGIVAYNAAAKIQAAGGMVSMLTNYAKASKVAAAAQAIFNTALWTSPITWIVAGIAAVVAGLALFFTKTETGRKMWDAFTQALGAGWDWVVDKFKAGISWITSTFGPVFSQIGSVISGVWDATVQKVTGAIERVKSIVSGALNFWKTGDSTDYAAALGLNPDSPIFTALEFFRDKLVVLKDFAIEAWGLMQEKWAEFTVGFGQFYETWIAPVFELFKMAAGLLWEGVKQYFDLLKQGWELLAQGFQAVWDAVLKPVFGFVVDAVKAWADFLLPIFQTLIPAAWEFLATSIKSVWENMIQPAWGLMRDTFGIVADILTGNFENLGNRFSSMGDHIMGVVTGPLQVAWDVLKAGVTAAIEVAKAVINQFRDAVGRMVSAVKGKIDDLVAGFRAMPGKIKAAFASAGTWLLEAGKNIIRGLAQGVRNAAGMVENAVRAVIPDNIERFVPGLHLGGVVPAFARGGVLPDVPGVPRSERDPILGWSTERKTPIARVEPGEFIVNRDATRKNLPLLAAINGGKLNGKMGDLGLPGFADGGLVGFNDVLKFLRGGTVAGNSTPRSLEGAPYVWGGGLDGNWGDCSGTQSAVAALVAGVDTTGRKFATGTQGGWLSQHGFKRGRGPGKNAFETAYFNGGPWGGHTAGTLFDEKGKSINIEMGGGRGNGQIGGPAAGSRHSQFTDVWWHPLKGGGSLMEDGKIVGTSTDGVTVSNGIQLKTIDWGTASNLASEWEKRNHKEKALRRWPSGVFDTGGILKPGNFAFNASGAPERVLDPAMTRSFDKIATYAPALADGMQRIAGVDWKGLVFELESAWMGQDAGYVELANLMGDRIGERVADKIAFAGAMTRDIQDGSNIRAYLENMSMSEGLDLGDQIGQMLGVDGLKSTFGGVVTSFEDMEDAAVAQVDAAEAVKQAEENLAKARAEYREMQGNNPELSVKMQRRIEDAEKNLAEARESGKPDRVAKAEEKLKRTREDAAAELEKNGAKSAEELLKAQEQVTAAEDDLAKAHGAVQLAAQATGQAQIAMMLEVARTAIKVIKGIIEFIDGRVQAVMQAHVAAFQAVAGAMESIGKLDAEVKKLRESVTGLMLDQAMAQIELAAAARNVRIAQMDGVASQLEATKSLAEAQAAFDEQRQADMRLAAMGYDDLSLAYDRFRWGMLDANGDVMDSLAAWSDESHALYSELLAAQVNQQLVEKQAQQANLEAAYKHTLAVIALNEVTASLQTAAQKLAVASGKAFGMDEVGATVGERYAELMAEKAAIKADQASAKTWLNPVNWFTSMPANRRRIEQIDQQLAELQARPEFQKVDQAALAEMDKAVKSSGWMGFFGAGDKVSDMVKNSALGDASRALEQMEFENRLIDIKSEQDKLRRTVEKNLAEVEYRKQLDPLETLIAGLEQERDSNKTWAEYWRTDNENVRKTLAELAGHQADYAGELKQMAAQPNKVVQISGDSFSREQLEAAMAELGVRVERLERPRASASQVVASRR